MSLNEKAKTTRQIIDKCVGTNKWKLDYEITGSNAPDLTEKWVRLEDHQQEINAYAIRLDSLQFCLDKCTKSFERLERERGEQKQKLQQTLDKIKAFYGFDNEACNILRKEFEELLRK